MRIIMSFLLSIFSIIAAAASPISEVYTGNTINGQGLIIPQGITPSISTNVTDTAGPATVISPAAPATGISYYQVYAVGSSNYSGWEYVSQWQTITNADHGGAQLRVVTLQYGYGNWISANINGVLGTHYLREYLCGSLSALHYCAVGEIITGFLDYFSFDGLQGGYYSSSASSTAVPFGTWTDAINIR